MPFAVRFGVTFSHLYEGNPDAALDSLETYLDEYRANGLDQQFPEVFIWNAMARINLENGRLEEAMKDYEKGYESVPDSNLPEDQKQTWLGRLHHGKAAARSRAWASTRRPGRRPRRSQDDRCRAARRAGSTGRRITTSRATRSSRPASTARPLEHLLQADANDPFDTLLLARAYEKLGRTNEAKTAYQKVLDSQWAGIERPLAFNEAKKKVSAL